MKDQEKLDKANAQLSRWLRKLKLANTKVGIYGRQITRLHKRLNKPQQPAVRQFNLD